MTLKDEVLYSEGVKFHPLAIVTAVLAYFGLGAVWFTLMRQAWMNGVGRTEAELLARNVSPALAYIVALLLATVLALFMTWLIQKTGPLTVSHGVQVAVVLWFCTIFVTLATEYAFEGRSVSTLAIVSGYPLLGMILMGAVLGGWPKKVG